MTNDGNDVVEYIEKCLSEIEFVSIEYTLQPISLLLLDINMPLMNGFETLICVKEIFERHNKRLKDSLSGDEQNKLIDSRVESKLMRPLIIFVSQLESSQFTHFFAADEKPDFYLEKPIVPKDLKALLRLIQIL